MVPLMRAAVSFWGSVPPNSRVDSSTYPTLYQTVSSVKKPIWKIRLNASIPATRTTLQNPTCFTRPLPR